MHRWLSKALAAVACAAAMAPALAQNVAHGQQIYNSICVTCHGPAPGVGGPEFTASNPALITTALQIVTQMRPFASQISSSDTQDIAAYIASVQGGGGGNGGGGTDGMPLFDYSDLWWNPGESGWGLNIVQHPSGNIFAVMYTYDAPDRPMWYVMPGGTWSASTVFTGALYRVTGSPASLAFKGGDVVQVGTATFSFSDASNGLLTYTVDGVQVSKPIQKQPF
ncbi:MAG TPA: cytochrome c [Usitatibacter sp.]|nr:cytochrome c [Usitatibacter sp.]